MRPLLAAPCLLICAISVGLFSGNPAPAADTGTLNQEPSANAPVANLTPADSLPVVNGKKVVASVGGDPITLEYLNMVIAQAHEEANEQTQAGRIDYAQILDRVITMDLFIHEARNIGFDDLPEIKGAVQSYSDDLLRKMQASRSVANVKPTASEIDAIYRNIIREYGIKAAQFPKKADAERAEKAIKAGKDFDAVIGSAIKKQIAVGDPKNNFYKRSELLPVVAAAVFKMKEGQVSPPIKKGNNYIILKLTGFRYPDSPEARNSAESQAYENSRRAAFDAYVGGLIKKEIRKNDKLLKSLDGMDFTSKQFDMEKFMSDKRVLATVEGDKPVTVGELANALNGFFYHGVATSKNREVRRKMHALFYDILQKRVLKAEALKNHIEDTDEYKTSVAYRENAFLFGEFIQKVIAQDLKVPPDALKTYYEKHMDDFSSPRMLHIENLAYLKKEDADEALGMLLKGDDFHWVKANSPGQAPAGTVGLLDFGSDLVPLTDLDPDLQKALSGTKQGDAKIYHQPKGRFYVLYIEKDVPPEPKPFEVVREEIKKIVFDQELNKAVVKWTAKLKEAYEVKIFDKRLQLQGSAGAGKP